MKLLQAKRDVSNRSAAGPVVFWQARYHGRLIPVVGFRHELADPVSSCCGKRAGSWAAHKYFGGPQSAMTDWEDSCRSRLAAHLDKDGDLEPPWEQFPDYERHCLGWRMGGGEDWLGLWHVFVQQLPQTETSRLAYLRRHPPAPINWADHIHAVLSMSSTYAGRETLTPARLQDLEQLGLIASDVAFTTWLQRQGDAIAWPWLESETPEMAARYFTRPLWFWSRQVSQLRANLVPPPLPKSWRICEQSLLSGKWEAVDASLGLQALAVFLCAGSVVPPWALGLSLADFKDSFDEDMGYVDAFRLWGMSCVDDAAQLERLCDESHAPSNWRAWLFEECGLVR